ncbi:hypothetical protein [Microbispora amethystogenes]|uniref:Uncharacterized protein n=1 Tax=Microbispora amethystogenes TaxID=1427754 RepID=A0ABQ4F8C8_9ACTN|nr:hypothetical protein [Microbispora amethystogenes]GIH31070.1 hypothetical protein Mam01_12340 [Microbispora amethystogenes]
MLYTGKTTASYFWDDGSGINGDTGAPASGEPMQKGLAASPSWPMGTKGYVIYQGKKADFFVGDRGPGVPSSNGVMLDLDGKTFADLTGGTWDSGSLTVEGAGGLGHIPVKYVITEWGEGRGKTGAPKPFSTGAYGVRDKAAPPPPCPTAAPAPSDASNAASGASEESQTTASTQAAKEAPAQKSAQESASPAAQAEAAAAAMAPFAGGQDAAGGAPPAARADGAETPAAAATTGTASVQAVTPVSATGDPSGRDDAAPAVSAAIVVCALVAVSAKVVHSRVTRRSSGDEAR